MYLKKCGYRSTCKVTDVWKADKYNQKYHMWLSNHENLAFIIIKIKVTCGYSNSMYYIIQELRIIQYWNEKWCFTEEQNNNIDWQVVRQTRVSLSINRKIWMTKQVSGICSTWVNMKLWELGAHKCHLCKAHKYNYHLFRYRSKIGCDKWEEISNTLEDNIFNNNTPTNAS